MVKSTLSFGDEEAEEDEGSSSKGKKKAADGDTESGTVPDPFAELRLIDNTIPLAPAAKRPKLKNPAVDTSFLPDRDREEQERLLREELRQKWLKDQEAVKKEDIEVTYSYWDGSGHRKSVTVSRPLLIHLLSSLNPSTVQKGRRYQHLPWKMQGPIP